MRGPGSLNRAISIGRAADRIFKERGIDPSLASLPAFEAETFPVEKLVEQMTIRRINRCLSRGALTDILGYDKDTLERWETGKCSPKLASILDWSQALGLELLVRAVPIRGFSVNSW